MQPLVVEEAERYEWDDFLECDTCRAKPGSPTMCGGCLHNREAISRLKQALRVKTKIIQTTKDVLSLADGIE